MRKTRKNYVVIALIILLLAVAVGYAVFSKTLTINGTANMNGNFDVKFTSATINASESKGIDTVNTKAVLSTEGDVLTITVKDLAYPGAGAVVDAVITNGSSTPIVVNSITPTNPLNADIVFEYPDLTNDEIAAGGSCLVKLVVKWKDDSTTTNPSTDEVSYSLKIDYTQKTDGGVTVNANHGAHQ